MIGTCSSCKAQYTTADEDMRHQIECSSRPRVVLSAEAEAFMERQRASDHRRTAKRRRTRADTSQDGG